jgi:hypothetical protein
MQGLHWTSMTGRQNDVAMVPAYQGQITWAPVWLSVSKIKFDDSCLGAEMLMHSSFTATMKDSLTRIERDCSLIGTVTQGSFLLLEAEYQAQGIAIEYLYNSIPGWIAHVEKCDVKRGFGSHQFWHWLRVALEAEGIIGCCPLVAP